MVLGIAFLLAAALSVQAQVPPEQAFFGPLQPDGSFPVVPGRSVGSVELGAARGAVASRLGDETRIVGWPGRWTHEVSGETHFWARRAAVVGFCRDRVFYASGYAVTSDVANYLVLNSFVRRLKTREGLTTEHSLTRFTETYGEPVAVARRVITSGDATDRPVALYKNGVAVITRPGSTTQLLGVGVYNLGICQ